MRPLLLALVLASGLVGCAESDAPISESGGGTGSPGTPLRCTTPTDTSPSLGVTFNVRFGEQATIASEPVSVTFQQLVDDTRPDGEATVVIHFEDPPHGPEDLTLSTNAPQGSHRGYTVTLGAVSPVPESGRPLTAPADYCVELTVTRN